VRIVTLTARQGDKSDAVIATYQTTQKPWAIKVAQALQYYLIWKRGVGHLRYSLNVFTQSNLPR